MGKISTKVIVIVCLSVLVALAGLVWITYLEWITGMQLLGTILGIIFAVGMILILYSFVNKKGVDNDLMLKLNATTMRKWIKDYMIEYYNDNVELADVRYLIVPGRTKEDESHLGYVELYGTTSHQNYHIIVSLHDPEGVHTVLHGKRTIEEIHEEAKYLTKSSYRPKRKTINYDEDNPTKIRSEINEDLVAPDVEEEIFNNVQKPKQK